MSVELTTRLLENERPPTSYQEVTHSMANDRNARLVRDSARIELTESAEMADLARAIKQKSFNDVAQMDKVRGRKRITTRISQVIDYAFYLTCGLISLQLMLELMGARSDNQIVQLIAALTTPLLSPFKQIVATPAAGAYQIQLSYLFALAFYLLLNLAINGGLRLITNRKVIV